MKPITALGPDGVDTDPKAIVPSLLQISKSIRAILGLRLAEIGIFNGQDEMLLCLEDGDQLSISTLADRLQVRPSTVSKMADRLAENGLLSRHRDLADTRVTLIGITEQGLQTRMKVMVIRERLETELRRGYAPQDTASLIESITALEKLLRRRVARFR